MTPDETNNTPQPNPIDSTESQPEAGTNPATSAPAIPDASQPGNSPDPNIVKTDLNKTQAAIPGPGSPTGPTSNVPAHQSIFRSLFESLAGGPRKIYKVNPETGNLDQTEVHLTKGNIGAGILAGAVAGLLGGANVHGPNGAERSFAAGANQSIKDRTDQDQAAQQKAKDDMARHYSIFETNMRMHQNALTIGKMDHDAHATMVDDAKPALDSIVKANAVKAAMVPESELSKYHITKDMALPDGVVQRTDEKGNIHYENTYSIIDPDANIALPKETLQFLADHQVPGYFRIVDGKTVPVNLPDDTIARARMVVNGLSKASAIKVSELAINRQLQDLHKVANGQPASGSVWEMYPNLDKLADVITSHEGKPGDVNYRNNNPGNLVFVNQPGAVMGEKGFAKFKTQADGRAALLAQLQKYKNDNPSLTPQQLISGDGNNFKGYSPDGAPGNAPGQAKAYSDDIVNNATKQPVSDTSEAPNVDIKKMLQDGTITAQALETYQKYAGLPVDQALDAMRKDKVDPSIIGQMSAIFPADVREQARLAREAASEKQKNDLKAQFENQKMSDEDKATITRNNNMIDAMGSGKLFDVRKIATMRARDRETIVNETQRRYPNWNPEEVEAKVNLFKDAADSSKSGSFGNSVSNANSYFGHTADAIIAIKGLKAKYPNITESEWTQKPVEWFNSKFENDPDWAKFKTALEPAGSDWFSLLKNQHVESQRDQETRDNLVDAKQPLANTIATLTQMARSAAIRIVPLNERWKQTMGDDFPNLIQPNTVQSLKTINDPEVNRLMAPMRSGGSLTGTSSGTGHDSKSVGELLGMSQPNTSNQPNEQTVQVPGQRPGEIALRDANGTVVGFTMPGKKGMRPIGTQQAASQPQPQGQ